MTRHAVIDSVSAELRTDLRAPMRLMVLMSLDGLQYSPAVVKDMSVAGFSIDSPVRFRLRDQVQILIGGRTPCWATIIHSHGNLHGCAFQTPISDAMFQSIVNDGPFAVRPPSPLPTIRRWPGWIRVPVIIVPAVIGWLAIYGLF